MQTIQTKLNPIQNIENKTSRHYFIKKINRYGIKQKRLTWFDFSDSTFNISTVENKGIKKFSIKTIMHFIKKSSKVVIIEFYKEINAKNLSLVFFTEEELNEYFEIAQKLQQSQRESKFQAKQSVIFKKELTKNRESRKFTWLNRNVTNDTSNKNKECQLFYNVLQVGIMSHEKRYLILDTLSLEVTLTNNRSKLIKKIKISDFVIQFFMRDNLRIVINTLKSSFELIFASVYLKYHFASNYYILKSPQKVIPSAEIRKNNCRVYTTTWNIGQKADPSEEVLEILLGASENYQIIAISFQECKPSKFNIWLKALTSYYAARNCSLLSYISMWDMFLVIYIEKSLISSVSDINTLKKATGIANIIGNKGGVLLSFRLETTSFCFLSCHLAARFNRLLIRNQNAKDLLNLRPSFADIEFSIEFDYVFWLGDFNYRIEENFYEAISIINLKNYEVLWNKDQMKNQVTANEMYSTFSEGPLNFKPTYRLIRNSDEWSNKREQTPSWTDRIIYKNHLPISLVQYNCIENCYGSDHRPVYAGFLLEIRHWYIPEVFDPMNDDYKMGIIEFPSLEIECRENCEKNHAMVSFYSHFIEGNPKSSQIELNSDKIAVFDGEKLPILSFIFSSPNVLKDFRVILTIHMVDVNGEQEIYGYANLYIRDLIEFVESNYQIDFKSNFNTDRSEDFKADIELNSRTVGKLRGGWTFNICSRSDQFRF